MKCLNRKDVITAYVNYDARKKKKPVPNNLANWPWSDPNALDCELRRHAFKHGIISGYKTWQAVELSRSDLLNCAIVNHIFIGLPQMLGELIRYPEFQKWKPNGFAEWYGWLESGNPFLEDWPLILRPAVKSEAPAQWYIEDGSGRAICFFRRLCKHAEDNSTAKGYLGLEPDLESDFMQQHF